MTSTPPPLTRAQEGDPAAEWVPLQRLEPWEDNPRINDNAAKKLAAFIEAKGWGAPIVAQSGTDRIIAGHTRWKAAHLLGLELVPVRFVDVGDRVATEMALADNKLGEEAAWDYPKLAPILESYSLPELDVMGFDSKWLEDMADKVEGFGPVDDGELGKAAPTHTCPECGFEF